MSRMLPCHVERRARQCKTLQGCGRSGKLFLVSLRGVLQLVRTPACHAGGRGFEPVAPAKFDEKNWLPRLGMSLVQLSRLPHEHNLARAILPFCFPDLGCRL